MVTQWYKCSWASAVLSRFIPNWHFDFPSRAGIIFHWVSTTADCVQLWGLGQWEPISWEGRELHGGSCLGQVVLITAKMEVPSTNSPSTSGHYKHLQPPCLSCSKPHKSVSVVASSDWEVSDAPGSAVAALFWWPHQVFQAPMRAHWSLCLVQDPFSFALYRVYPWGGAGVASLLSTTTWRRL